MEVQKALGHFRNKHGQNDNCALAVEAAFREKAGTPKCRRTLRARAFKCAGCVEPRVRLIQEMKQPA